MQRNVPSSLRQTLYIKANQTFYLDILKPLKHDATELDTESSYMAQKWIFVPVKIASKQYWLSSPWWNVDSKELYQMLIEKQKSAPGEALDLLLSTAYNNVTAQICAHRDLWLIN